jgi:ribosomal protein L11 methyltransferase
LIRLSVRVRGDDQGVVLAELLELSPAGVEERAVDGGTEYVIYGPPGELPALPLVEAAAGDVLVEVSAAEIPDDWDERWKQWHRPLELTRLRVRPPWEPPVRDGRVELVIDPGQAFGTGAHATTRLCLELLLELEPSGGFADWGCGTGVLAIAAAKLGYAPVAAVDHDPLAVDATRANAEVNGVALEVGRVNLREAAGPAAPTVCANLLRPLLLEVAARLAERPRALIVSGLLAEEAADVAAAFAPMAVRARRDRDGWAALLLEAKPVTSPEGEAG